MIFDAARKGNNQTSGPDMTPKYSVEEEKERERKWRKRLEDDKLRTLDRIKEYNIPDSIFFLVLHNNEIDYYRDMAEYKIDVHERFKDISPYEIEDWISKSDLLSKSNYWVGEAYLKWLGASEAEKKAAYQKYLSLKDKLVSDFPGFSNFVYDHVLEMGCYAAR